MIINREKYLQELISSRHNGLVKIITGMRRCGKSFLLFRLFKRFLEDDGGYLLRELEDLPIHNALPILFCLSRISL